MPLNEAPASNGEAQNDWKVDPSVFAFTPRKLRVVCIGAGFSGLTIAYKLKHETPLEFVDFTIYEKNPEVGGTWFENIYPGVACDIPVHSYQFPFAPNPAWSSYYATGKEIQEYIVSIADKYDLKEKVKFNTKLVKAIWSEVQGKWKLQLQQGEFVLEDEADIVLDGSGVLNKWKWPNIEGLDTFKGKLLHTARWDLEYNYEGKKIAVLGNGSSGIQIIPSLQPKAAKLVNYIRHATWISPNLCGQLTRDGMGTNFQFTSEEKQQFQDDPEKLLEYRKSIEGAVNSVYAWMISGSEENKALYEVVHGVMRSRLSKSPELLKTLIPAYEVGCRRISPGDGYLEAIQEDNARITLSNINRITPNGIETDEGEEEFDLIVCATGFDYSFIPPWELIGRDGRRLDEEWKDIPEAYFATCAGGVPNYFMFGGPNYPIGHGSLPAALDSSADYMLQWIKKIAVEDIKSVVVKDSVVRDYNKFAQETLKRCVWSKGCHAWYSKRNEGADNTVTAMYPGSALHFKACMEKIRPEDFEIQYNTTNPFRFMGNGQLAFERVPGADLAFYLK
ncbi:putative flavin-binding monooxygenase [Aspergillus pseudonomiae]|uniref:Putative flavin-binding monooxygenase n=1 Tax=Aspergillus pseudonomiae TaxID=1506151 RepID=A0A5N7DGH2_9EURO|nr:putative flavin-binding monooxygenase [Aspergillus pseudonomiae]KAE8405536.1 putative flavin-binding monooxygenase [Aspergillus pseudonomiae]